MENARKAEIIAIAVLAKKTRAICHSGQLLWTIPEDLKRVKMHTLNHPIIMGRKTYDSIGHPLPQRTNIVITRNTDLEIKGCIIAHSLEEALKKAEEIDQEKIFIFGGAEIYRLAMEYTDKLMLTIVDSDKEGDAHFPEYEKDFVVESDEEGGIYQNESYRWVTLARKV